jgi:hypothetical protein
MTNKLESEKRIDQALFKQLYDSATLKIPDKLRRQGMNKKNPDYNKVLKTTIELFLSKNGLIKTIMEEPRGDAKILFDNIFSYLKAPDIIPPNTRLANQQKDLFEAT